MNLEYLLYAGLAVCAIGFVGLGVYGCWRLCKSRQVRQEEEAAAKKKVAVDAAYAIARKRVNLDAARARLEKERRELARVQQGVLLHNPSYQPLSNTTLSLPNLSSSFGEESGLVRVAAQVHRDAGQDPDRVDVLDVELVELDGQGGGASGRALEEQEAEVVDVAQAGVEVGEGQHGQVAQAGQSDQVAQAGQGIQDAQIGQDGDLGRGKREKKRNVRLTGFKVNLGGYHSEWILVSFLKIVLIF